MDSIIAKDLYRYCGSYSWFSLFSNYIRKPHIRYLVRLRRFQKHPCLLNRLLLLISTHNTHIEIGWKSQIGAGLVLIHPCGISINNMCVLGHNCNIYGGVTIGMEFRGKRIGCPVLGNRVWIGTNAVLVGKIIIGDDVLIAPNAFVNFDVPSHSVVIGNPGKIIHMDNATDHYICRV